MNRPAPLTALTTVLSVAVALLLCGLLILTTGYSPTAAARAIVDGSLADAAALTSTLLYAAPLLLVAVGSCVSARAGVFNIGQEGQVLIGAFAGAWFALRLAITGPAMVVIMLLGATAGGALWAWLSALMYRWRGVNVVVSTLLMVFVAQQLVGFATSQAWFLQQSKGDKAIVTAQSNQIPAAARLGSIGQYPNLMINLGLILAVIATVAVAVLLAHSRWGFRISLTGLSPTAARHAGVRTGLVAGLALVTSGAFSGLAGALMLASPIGSYRLQSGVSSNVGWDGLLVALVARNQPWLCVPVALVFGMLRSGGNFLSATGVPYYLVDVVKSLLVLALVIPPVLTTLIRARADRRRAGAAGGTRRPVSLEVSA